MGYGDFKLLAALGAWLGWQMLPLIVLLSSVVGAVIGIALIVFKGRDHQHAAARSAPTSRSPGAIALFFGPTARSSTVSRRELDAMTLVVGLTGGIGSGKTAVADAFAALGVDGRRCRRDRARAVGRRATPGNERWSRRSAPPRVATDGSLDRGWLREQRVRRSRVSRRSSRRCCIR